MNILYHHRTQGRSGEGVHIRETIKAFRSLGHDVFIVSPPGVDVFAEDEQAEPCEVHNAWLTHFWSWISKVAPQVMFELMEICYNAVAVRNINKIITNNKIDFIYERYAFFLWAGTSIAKKNKIPIILEVNEVSGIGRQRGQALTVFANKIEKDIFKNSNSIVVVSSYLRGEAIKRSVDPDKVTIIPNGVNEVMFSPIEENTVIRNKLGLNDGIVLGFAGYFSKWDRLSNFMEVFCDIAKDNSSVRLMVIGDSRKKEEREEFERIVKAKGMGDRVVFSGRVKRRDMPRHISAVDICVIPHSNPFGSPLVLFEYMSMAKAIVAPRIAPITDVIADGNNGVLFEPGDLRSLKHCIIDLANDREKRLKLGVTARTTIMTGHTWINNAERIFTIRKSLNL